MWKLVSWILYVLLYAGTLLLCTNCAWPPADYQKNANPGFFTSFYSDQPLHTSLIFNLDSVIFYKKSEKEISGSLILRAPQQLTIHVEISTRGITRKDICDFPPMRVQLKKVAASENHWSDYRNYKLITHCSDTLVGRELLLREYLVYKLYERLTPISFRVQLLQMQYVLPTDTLDRYAVLIENEEEMNDRLGLKAIDPKHTQIKSIHMEGYKRFVLFQYMIGNTDWNLSSGHNTKLVLEANSNTPIVIPYDFDFCGLVNAPYARPFETIPIRNVRERYFMYRGKKEDDFSSTLQEFRDLKNDWYAIVDACPYVSQGVKQDVRSYLEEFFAIIEQADWKDKVFPPG